MYGLEQLMQQTDFAADILLLRRGQLSSTAGGFSLIRLADNKQHLMPVCLTNHLMIKMLIHRQRPVIGLNQPQHQVKPGKLFAYSAAYSYRERHFRPHRADPPASYGGRQPADESARFTGAGRHIADRRYFAGKQGIAKATLSRAGLPRMPITGS
jgi:hypothetical protein